MDFYYSYIETSDGLPRDKYFSVDTFVVERINQLFKVNKFYRAKDTIDHLMWVVRIYRQDYYDLFEDYSFEPKYQYSRKNKRLICITSNLINEELESWDENFLLNMFMTNLHSVINAFEKKKIKGVDLEKLREDIENLRPEIENKIKEVG